MILVNGVKYACELCIRGHRAASCHHSDRQLIMVKKKGRPSTTCGHCKELRAVKNVNPSGTCLCAKKKISNQEFSPNQCRCTQGEPCKCHSNRKKNRKTKKENVNSLEGDYATLLGDSNELPFDLTHALNNVDISNLTTQNNNLMDFSPSSLLEDGTDLDSNRTGILSVNLSSIGTPNSDTAATNQGSEAILPPQDLEVGNKDIIDSYIFDSMQHPSSRMKEEENQGSVEHNLFNTDGILDFNNNLLIDGNEELSNIPNLDDS